MISDQPFSIDSRSLARWPGVRAGFSLIEMMIAIVILGLGLTMVATMFPVAWERTRRLNDQTIGQAMVPAIRSQVESIVPVSGVDMDAAGLAGDLIVDADYGVTGVGKIVSAFGGFASDTRVHALNVQNVRVENRAFVSEDPWRLERMPGLPRPGDVPSPTDLLADGDLTPGPLFASRTYHTPRLEFHQRVHAPLPRRDTRPEITDPITGEFKGADPQWDLLLDGRRFASAVLHRMVDYVGPFPGAVPSLNGYSSAEAWAKDAVAQPRRMELYLVSLRRPQSARFARQDPDSTVTPDPYELTATPAPSPRALPATDDVLFPVAWRVQIQLPSSTGKARLSSRATPSGIPTEVQVPPGDLPIEGRPEAIRLSLVQMFPVGTSFIDEVNGQVYKVAQRRLVPAKDGGENAILTLDREVFMEDVDLPDQDPRCDSCQVLSAGHATPDPPELLRTVWVFPPPVASREANEPLPFFDGGSPVLGVEVRAVTIAPR